MVFNDNVLSFLHPVLRLFDHHRLFLAGHAFQFEHDIVGTRFYCRREIGCREGVIAIRQILWGDRRRAFRGRAMLDDGDEVFARKHAVTGAFGVDRKRAVFGNHAPGGCSCAGRFEYDLTIREFRRRFAVGPFESTLHLDFRRAASRHDQEQEEANGESAAHCEISIGPCDGEIALGPHTREP